MARQEADRLVLEKPEHIQQRLKARFAQVPLERRRGGVCGMTVVLDASALLAYLLQEPGAEMVQKALSAGVDVEGKRDELWPHTRQQGLSLGDRACLSLGLRLGLTV